MKRKPSLKELLERGYDLGDCVYATASTADPKYLRTFFHVIRCLFIAEMQTGKRMSLRSPLLDEFIREAADTRIGATNPMGQFGRAWTNKWLDSSAAYSRFLDRRKGERSSYSLKHQRFVREAFAENEQWIGRRDVECVDALLRRIGVVNTSNPDSGPAKIGMTPTKGETRREGRKFLLYSERAERSPQNRELCIQYYGLSCTVCGFNFEATYGPIGKDFIHVHHLRPLSLLDDEEVDPITDMIPLCPNCHAMAHRCAAMPFSPEEIRSMITEYGMRSASSE